MKRGDLVVVEFPYVDGRRGKNRPVLAIQNDRDNQRLTNSIVAMISGNLRHASEPTQLLIDPNHLEGASSGLRGRSIVKCDNLLTIRQQRCEAYHRSFVRRTRHEAERMSQGST